MVQSERDRKDGSLKDYVGKCREAAEYLRLLQHCKRCDGNCNNTIGCRSTKSLLSHVDECMEDCDRQGCKQTKKILLHYRNCRLTRQQSFLTGSPVKFCIICSLAVREEEQSASKCSVNFNSGIALTKRRSSETDFKVPLLPKRFRDVDNNHDNLPSDEGIELPRRRAESAPQEFTSLCRRIDINSKRNNVHDNSDDSTSDMYQSPTHDKNRNNINNTDISETNNRSSIKYEASVISKATACEVQISPCVFPLTEYVKDDYENNSMIDAKHYAIVKETSIPSPLNSFGETETSRAFSGIKSMLRDRRGSM